MAGVDLVVPIKELARAKTRLAGAVTTTARTDRADLALALALDTLAAVLASAVRRVVVVTSDDRVAAAVTDLAGAGRLTVVDDPARGLNAAVEAGARSLLGGADPTTAPVAVAALLADLPALRPAELDEALDAALVALDAGTPGAFVGDHTGHGTTLVVLPAGDVDGARFRFGGESAAAHRGEGLVALAGRWPGLRHDVDTPDDLRGVRERGVGPATRAWTTAPARRAGTHGSQGSPMTAWVPDDHRLAGGTTRSARRRMSER